MKFLPLVLIALLSFGCSTTTRYVTLDGTEVETDSDGAYYMALRDISIGSEQSFNKAITEAKTDFQSFAITVNRLVGPKTPLSPKRTWDERLLEWVKVLSPYFAGGINNRRHVDATSYVYNVSGDGNSMSGIGNTFAGGGGSSQEGDSSMVVDMHVDNHPYVTKDYRTYSSNKSSDLSMGDDQSVSTETLPAVAE